MDYAEFRRIGLCFSRWLALRAVHEPRFLQAFETLPLASFLAQLSADVDHSALLRRMVMEGKEPLADPPPLQNAYPVYPD